MKYIQDQFITHLGLERVKKLGSEKYNFKCPLCNEGHSKTKRRGYLLWNKRYNTYVFNCFNCGTTTNFKNILKILSPTQVPIYEQKEKEENFRSYIHPIKEEKLDDSISIIGISLLPKGSTKCSDNSVCLEYCLKRKIPQKFIKKWYYHKDYGLIVPFELDNESIYGWQSRNLDTKYFHIELPENNPKIWNWFNINKDEEVFISESIIDASMLYYIGKQSIAAIGSDISTEYLAELKYPVFIFDNDKTGKTKTIKYSKLLPNAKFLVWDKRIHQKDLNEIITSSIPIDKFKKFIEGSLKTGYEIQIQHKMNLF